VDALLHKLPPGHTPRGEHMVVNTEWGDLHSELLPLSEEDLWVDCSSANPGAHANARVCKGARGGALDHGSACWKRLDAGGYHTSVYGNV
jgi:hypothetical protein